MSEDASLLIEKLNKTYDQLHHEKEQLFWTTKMGISDDFDSFNKAEEKLMAFTQNIDNLEACRKALPHSKDDAAVTLKGWISFFATNVMENKEAIQLNKDIIKMESNLARARKGMQLGYTDPSTGEHISCSSVELSLKLASDSNPDIRKAAFEGLRSIETFVLDNGFLDIIKARNQMARLLGYLDFYSYKLDKTEGINMGTLFSWLDTIETKTRDAGKRLVSELVKDNGEEAVTPWNFRYYTQGQVIKDLDPYMPFSKSVQRWGQSFSAMGVSFEGAKLQLDLIDRKGKYENGFCHAPVAPYRKDDGTLIRAEVNFTSNAVPKQMGSGYNALQTLFHEGGHAAHFSNIFMGAPCFSQEFAPSSVAMAETQSMFFDSLLSDSDWLSRYAGVPWEVIENKIKKTHPLRAVAIRQMLIVPFVERAIYCLPDEELSTEKVMNICRNLEKQLSFIEASPRPTLAIPHLLEMESSAYYHGYILAQCAVEQTRKFFFKRDGHIIDNPKIGPELASYYWRKGNSELFVDFVKSLTNESFSVEDLVDVVSKSVEDTLNEQKERLEFIEGIPRSSGPLDLNLHIQLVHGSEHIASTDTQSFEEAAREFETWLERTFKEAT
ncbi:MAG: oligoendopeptidase F [Chlamydiales bacterium]|jgi:oligoendopeptidase F